MADTFSKRYGYKKPPDRLLREDAPDEMRHELLAIFGKHGLTPMHIGDKICEATRRLPEAVFGSAHPGWLIVRITMRDLRWFEVYDVVELVCAANQDMTLEEDINELFDEHGIGWKVAYGVLEERGDETHERLVQGAVEALKATGRPTAADEMKEAIAALSRRPEPDSRGAVNRAVGAVEALARDVTKDPKVTLGQLADKLDLPAPLDQAVAKLWGFASEQARHVREGQSIELDEAYLVVNLCAVLASYLCGPSRGPN